MTHEARLFSGDVMAQHWSDEDGGMVVMAAKTKGTKERTTKRVKGTGKKTC